jgi:hypothetical protein
MTPPTLRNRHLLAIVLLLAALATTIGADNAARDYRMRQLERENADLRARNANLERWWRGAYTTLRERGIAPPIP